MEAKEYINQEVIINANKNAILSAIVYFDVFNFPLKKNEILEYSKFKGTIEEFDNELNNAIGNNFIKKEGEYYLSNFASVKNITQRNIKEKYTLKIKPKVVFYSNLISKFPFVESVCISGSYSKGVTDPDGDVDYFIICKPQRLWICRTLLILFKKIFLLNSRKYFCVNYFIDSDNLLVPDKNLFVATEIKFLIPMYNLELFQKFQAANSWANEYMPNKKSINSLPKQEIKFNPFKTFVERILNNKLGDLIDTIFLKLTLKKWKNKFKEMNLSDFDLNMRTRRNVSKHHPQGFQNKVLRAMEEGKSKMYQFAKSI